MATRMDAPAARPGARRWLVRGAVGAAAVAALVLGGRALGGVVPEIGAWFEARGAWGALAFVALYAVWTAALLPASALTLVAGAVFGPVLGTAVALAGATVGSTGAFLGARHLFRPAVERRVGAHPRFRALDRAVARDGLRMVFLLRLSPVLPFNLLNVALGLTGVRLRDFVLASAGMLPGTVLYVWTGRVAGDVAAAAAGAAPARGAGYWAVLGLGLAATAAVSVMLARLARKAIREAEEETT